MEKTISIVMPVKNEALYLRECLDSIVSQSFKDWELWICDDHSNDNTLEIIVEYCDKYPSINYLINKEHGIIPALNLAYSKCTGKYITRMDGDDIMPPKKLETLFSLLQKKGRGYVATGKVKYFPEEDIADGFYTYQNWLNSLCINQNHWDEVYKECVIPSPCWLAHRQDFDSCGGFKDSVYPEDYDLVFRMYTKGLKVIASQDILHLWRDHALRTSRNSEHYQTQTFFELKLKYFLSTESIQGKNLVIWGAGKKGKVLAGHLNTLDKKFHWVCNNKNKIGHEILGIVMQDYLEIEQIKNPVVLITVSGHEDRSEIVNFLEKIGLKPNKSFFMFC